MRHSIAALAALALLAAVAACDVSFAPGPPTRDLENGAADSLTAAKSVEITGAYDDGPDHWLIDLQVVRPDTEHFVITGPVKLEAIVVGETAYFRGQQFLAQHMGTDPVSQQKVRAAGNAWWKGSVRDVLRLPHFTDGDAFKSTFLGPVASRRTDHLSIDGFPAVDLAGVRGDVYIAAVPPYQLLRVHLNKGVAVDGVTGADLRFTNFDRNFGVLAPQDVIDFSNLSTLPPIYYVMSVDTSGCGSPCSVSAVVKNLGGSTGAKAPSAVSFVVTDAASGKTVGSCTAQIAPDVGYNATTTVGCTLGDLNGQLNAAIVTATVDNPGRG